MSSHSVILINFSLAIHLFLLSNRFTMKYCNSCSKTSDDFSDQQGFNRHLKSHQGELSCDQFEKVLKNRWVLMKHIKTVHNNKTFTCDHYNKIFQDKANLNKHLTIHEQRNVKPKKTLKHCGICRTFQTTQNSRDIWNHMKKQ